MNDCSICTQHHNATVIKSDISFEIDISPRIKMRNFLFLYYLRVKSKSNKFAYMLKEIEDALGKKNLGDVEFETLMLSIDKLI